MSCESAAARQSTPPQGATGGPAQPPKIEYIEREILAIMASALTPEIWFEIAQAVIEKAKTGNMTAVQWLSRTFLSGKLNAAAASEAVRLPPHVESYELGCANHRDWMHWVKEKREEAERKGQPDVWAMGYANPVERAAARATTAPAKSRPATTPAPSAVPPSPAPAQPARTVPAADRVQGFRVTQGAPAENGVYRSNTEENAAPNGLPAAR